MISWANGMNNRGKYTSNIRVFHTSIHWLKAFSNEEQRERKSSELVLFIFVYYSTTDMIIIIITWITKKKREHREKEEEEEQLSSLEIRENATGSHHHSVEICFYFLVWFIIWIHTYTHTKKNERIRLDFFLEEIFVIAIYFRL